MHRPVHRPVEARLLEAAKTAFAEGDMHMLHDGVVRAAPRPDDQLQHRLLLADGHCLDAAIGAIAHPADHAELRCLLDHGPAIADALDPTFDDEMPRNAAHTLLRQRPEKLANEIIILAKGETAADQGLSNTLDQQ